MCFTVIRQQLIKIRSCLATRVQFLKKNLETDLSSLITLATIVFAMLNITRGLQIFKKLASGHHVCLDDILYKYTL